MDLIKNQDYEIVIEDMGNDGEGIGHIGGMTVFVKDTVMGDVAFIKIIKLKKNIAYGRLVKLITPSKYRVEPVCKIARQCGGCTMQHVSYEKQLDYKWNKVKNCLARIGKVEHPEERMEPVLGMEHPYHYRNKSQFPTGRDKDGNVVIGFYAGRTHSIIDTKQCVISAEINDRLTAVIRKFLTDYHISTYDEQSGEGLVRHILTRVGFATGEIMVCLVINGTGLCHAQRLVDALTEIEGMTSVCLNINQEKTNRILGDQCVTLWGRDFITDYIGDIKYQISPLSFFQVNPVQTKVLYEKVLEYADLKGDEVVWDMYCGIGTISLFLARNARQVFGVEAVPQAIEDAKKNAELNHITNAEFYTGKAEEVVPAVYRSGGAGSAADVVVVDPPRKGCDAVLLDTLVQMQPQRIVYVSCDPATLARDVAILQENGYTLRKAAVVDQFCHSGHVETVVLLSQRKPDDVIEVEIELGEMDLTSAESKATYAEIKDYVLKEHGLKVSNLYISQVKRKCGIEVGENYNLPKSEDSRQPQCPEEKEKAIKDALDHFGMI